MQSRHLGLFRSDYLLHSAETSGTTTVSLKQVEFNTISSSFGALSQNVAKMHRCVYIVSRLARSGLTCFVQVSCRNDGVLQQLAYPEA